MISVDEWTTIYYIGHVKSNDIRTVSRLLVNDTYVFFSLRRSRVKSVEIILTISPLCLPGTVYEQY